MLTLFKTTFYLKFHTLAVKIGQKENKIGNMKLKENPLMKLELHFKTYLKKKIAFGEEKLHPSYRLQKRYLLVI